MNKLKVLVGLLVLSVVVSGSLQWFRHGDTEFVTGHCYEVEFGAIVEGAPVIEIKILETTERIVLVGFADLEGVMLPIPKMNGMVDTLFEHSTRVWCGL